MWGAKAKARRKSRPRLTPADLNRLRQLSKLRQEEQQTVINLGITGNVDRETRRNVVRMLTDGSIANGVNAFNRERGVR